MTTTSTHARSTLLALAAALGCLLAGSTAHAAVYIPTNGSALQNALDDAAGTPGEDEIHLGPGVFSREDGFHYDSGPNEANRIAIKGTPGQTVVQTPSDLVLDSTKVLELRGTGGETSYVHGVKVRMPLISDSNNTVTGLLLERAAAINVVVEPRLSSGGFAQAGITLEDGGTVRAAKVTAPQPATNARAILVSGADALVQDTEVIGGFTGIEFDQFGDGRVTRARVDARKSAAGIACEGCGDLDLDNSSVRVDGDAAGLLATGGSAHPVVFDASHVTVVGEGAGSGVGAAAVAHTGTKGAVLRMDNCVLWNLVATLYRYGESGTYAQMATRNCDYPIGNESDKGPGAIDAGANMSADPGFVHAPSGNFRLRWSSPLIDQGRTMGLFVDSPFALDHANRIAPGKPGAGAEPDMGAYEYQAHKPKLALVAPGTAQAGVPFTLDASKSWGGDPGEPVTWKWTLPGGGTATTPIVSLKLPAGQHVVGVTITDPTGQTASDQRTIGVAAAPRTSRPSAAPLLANVRVAPARMRRGARPTLRFRLARRGVVTARVQRRAGGHWRPVRRLTRTLAAGDRRLALPRATRSGRWRVVMKAHAGETVAGARVGYRVR